MEFVTLSFAEILSLQNIENKDEEEDLVITKKSGGRRKPTNKGERVARKKAKMAKKAVAKNYGYLYKKGESFVEVFPLSMVDGSSYGRIIGNVAEVVSPRELAHKANEPRWSKYDHLCKEEMARKAERRVEHSERSAKNVLRESADHIRKALKDAEYNLGYAQYMVDLAESRHNELNDKLSRLQYEPATCRSVKEAYEEYCDALRRRDDFIPELRKWRALYKEELSTYNQAKADYDELPFWL